MNAYNPYNQYKANQIGTASQGDLLIMLYNGAIKFITLGKNAMVAEKWEQVNENLDRVQKIISELMIALDMENGGDIAKNLYNLYFFMKREILRGNLKKNPENLDNVLEILTELRNTWKIVVEKEKREARVEMSGVNIKS